MRCLHPFCPMSYSTTKKDWTPVVGHSDIKIPLSEQSGIAAFLNTHFGDLSVPVTVSTFPTSIKKAVLKRLLKHCPCLFTQIDLRPTARAVVHLCELTLGKPIDPSNVHQAFLIQHPRPGTPPWKYPPQKAPKGIGGSIMEFLCSEVLATAGIPPMPLDAEKWPQWQMPGHVIMNEGKMNTLKAFGDILIPCAPTNLVISVKSEAARERLLYSANSIEGIGFGFFREPEEFWTVSRMSLYKRMGFSAIYMPDETHAAIMAKLEKDKTQSHAVNINGGALYRPLTVFGEDMRRVVGRSSLLLDAPAPKEEPG